MGSICAQERLRGDWLAAVPIGWSEVDRALERKLAAAQDAAHAGLCENFNTRAAMMALPCLDSMAMAHSSGRSVPSRATTTAATFPSITPVRTT